MNKTKTLSNTLPVKTNAKKAKDMKPEIVLKTVNFGNQYCTGTIVKTIIKTVGKKQKNKS
jgi:hypothetical protein